MVEQIKSKMKELWKYSVVILFGSLIIIGTLTEFIFGIDIDSDWFWLLAGVALKI